VRKRSPKKAGSANFRGEITVFLALSLSACILFAEAALESARAFMLRVQAENALESAMDSLFAGYDADLFEKYGILFLNRAQLPQNLTVEELLEDSMGAELNPSYGRITVGGNLLRSSVVSVQVTETRDPVSYAQGEYYARSVLDYMKYRAVAEKIQEIRSSEEISQLGEEARKQNEINRSADSEAVKQAEKDLEEIGKEEGKEDWKNRTEEDIEKSFIGRVDELRKEGIMRLVVPSVDAVSHAAVPYSDYPSLHYADSVYSPLSFMKETSISLLLADYAMEHFRCYADGGGDGALRYEQEYILSGKSNDYDNLSACIDSLLLVREGMNILTLASTPRLLAEASAFTAELVGWTGSGAVSAVTEGAVVASWAFGEAVLDVRSLLAGEKVPLQKTGEEWVTRLERMIPLLTGKNRTTAHYNRGMDYGDYVCMLMLKVQRKKRQYRMMDLTEFDLRRSDPDFRMQNCVYGMSVTVTVTSLPLFSGIGSTGEFLFTVSGSRMY
jgi:hypothetical protein